MAKKTPEFRWTPQVRSTFEQIKDAMVRAQVVVVPDTSPYAKYTMYTDAFGFPMGVVWIYKTKGSDYNMLRIMLEK
jgi:hypothetical protein